MRGKDDGVAGITQSMGITPAYAGKSRPLPPPLPPDGDHPRLCGEKQSTSSEFYRLKGSPPPMRGKALFASISVTASGITPAYAGKSARFNG